MPAITVVDTSKLPRVDLPGPDVRQRPVVSVTTAPRGLEGEGSPVRRAFSGVEPKGTPWQPHRGFETVTYMMDGIIADADSTGGGGRISDGDTQWMTAGSGILHIEAPPEEVVAAGGLFHGLQLWVNLPRADKWIGPQYQELAGNAVTLLTSPDGGCARTSTLEVLLLGGEPSEPVAFYGPFVMNTSDEIQQAFDDFRAGRLGTVPASHAAPTHEVAEQTDATLD